MKKVPRLRFRGFQEDWELCKLKEITERVKGNDGRMDLPTLTISAGQGWLNQKDRFSGNIAGKEQKNYTLLLKNELSYNHGNSKLAKYGAVFSLKTYEEALVPRVYHSFKSTKNSDPDFLEYIFATKKPDKELGKLVSSGARMDGLLNINYDDFSNIKINIPHIHEQKKISNLLRKIDNTITLHQRKLEQLKELKKAYLQVMFPVKDEGVPKLRFADFEEEWEQCKLEDLANKYNNLRIPITASKRIYGNTPYYGANGIQDFVEGYTHDGEFILVAEDGASNLKDYPVQYVNGKVWVNNHAHVLQAKRSKADNKFLMNAIKSINIEPFLVGGGRSKLNSEVMMNLEINTPSKDEQLKISTLCKQLDDITALYQNKLNQLKNLKKSYLQNMFI
ncbi:hypothetical protein IE368CO2PC_01371 [Enterococcus faecalis]|nr:hypothetical protein IE368CO2PC_01371 [Enterococcus faecalis]CAC9731688.1 hypothetical protein IE368CO2GC_01244 [Enterococcus faecalis]CAC9733811.1 hypothetical protein IE368ANAPC_01321 [Enterococcus faecalis]CAC9734589.1 hypothetical protein IE188HC_01514 [Enterococcus faecalis]CAC9734951.1 hypothetical protein IE368AEMC_01391 [Enterococcus faecalis]